jgi:hypothetical protein
MIPRKELVEKNRQKRAKRAEGNRKNKWAKRGKIGREREAGFCIYKIKEGDIEEGGCEAEVHVFRYLVPCCVY